MQTQPQFNQSLLELNYRHQRESRNYECQLPLSYQMRTNSSIDSAQRARGDTLQQRLQRPEVTHSSVNTESLNRVNQILRQHRHHFEEKKQGKENLAYGIGAT